MQYSAHLLTKPKWKELSKDEALRVLLTRKILLLADVFYGYQPYSTVDVQTIPAPNLYYQSHLTLPLNVCSLVTNPWACIATFIQHCSHSIRLVKYQILVKILQSPAQKQHGMAKTRQLIVIWANNYYHCVYCLICWLSGTISNHLLPDMMSTTL
jgi:hypothetical protein